MASNGKLYVDGVEWRPWCRFPTIEKDLLLYLAVLGGKTFSGYYDLGTDTSYSTLDIFSMYLKGPGFSTAENTNAVGNNSKIYESMVAHMIFCASRRHGVRGIPFKDFFPWLLRECQDELASKPMVLGARETTISGLLEGYDDLAQLLTTNIPFLAPPNALWPQNMLRTTTGGLNLGHLNRLEDKHGCDICVYAEDRSGSPLFLCECKYWDKNVDMNTMENFICGLESVWKEKWKIVDLFCGGLAKVKSKWKRHDIGCVKIKIRVASARGFLSQP